MASEGDGRRWKTWQLLAAAGVAFVLGIGAGASGGSGKDKTVAATGQTEPSQTTVAPSPTSRASVATTPASTTTTLATTTTAAAAPVDIATFTGSSTKTTDTFAVRNPWRLRWTITGGAGVGIEVLDQAGNRLDYISTDPGTDESVIRRACTCYLKLTPFGSSYTVKVNGIPA